MKIASTEARSGSVASLGPKSHVYVCVRSVWGSWDGDREEAVRGYMTPDAADAFADEIKRAAAEAREAT